MQVDWFRLALLTKPVQERVELVIEHPDVCYYHGYRYPPDHDKEYQPTEVFWHLITARLAFVVIFQNLVSLVVELIKFMVPDVPARLKVTKSY